MSANSTSHQSLYAQLVEQAMHLRDQRLIYLNVRKVSMSMESLSDSQYAEQLPQLTVVVSELNRVNTHIEVDEGLVADAAADYEEIGRELIRNLKWEEGDIKVLPQGSSSTRTLIKSPTAEKFDIDAVCKVDLNRSEVWEPMQFFDQFQTALINRKATAKNRCWRIDGLSPRYYIEFTPSVPLLSIPANMLRNVRYSQTSRYSETALAVVDRPTKTWKTSNPQGITRWVDDQSKRQLVIMSFAERQIALAQESIEGVPAQSVPLSDTLRVAIRLFKRHRDMMVNRGLLDGDFKPISVLIVTLLTQCYEGLADRGATYEHPIELLCDLAELMPGMIEQRNGDWWIENPTVAGENFAERWNNDNGERKDAFDQWCDQLLEDLNEILGSADDKIVRERIRVMFGSHAASAPMPPKRGLATGKPSVVITPPPGKGLA